LLFRWRSICTSRQWGVIALTDSKKRHPSALAEITRGLAQLHTEYYGKGPTKGRTYMVDDTVVCFLHGGFTTVERTLIDGGRAGAVHEIRRSFQMAMETPFRDVVENATKRKVIAYLSQIHHNPDLAVEFFMLDGSTNGNPSEHAEVAEYVEELREPVT
jgi:uncharacterized protein YbcI